MLSRPAALAAFAVVLSSLGCGPSRYDFVGLWSYTSGTGQLTCTTSRGSQTQALSSNGNVSFVRGTDSDLVVVDGSGCNIKFNVTANQASVVPGQTCTRTSSDGVKTTVQVTSYTELLSSDLKTLTESFSATVLMEGPGGQATCTMTSTGALSKAGG